MNIDIKKISIIAATLFFSWSSFSYAANVGDNVSFNVNKDFDSVARSQISSTLIKITNNIYFYVEKSWWDAQPLSSQSEVLTNLENFSVEFENTIYPKLTSTFGFEAKPGIDSDTHISILFQSMKESAGGYFRSADEYYKLQVPDSNEREMIYINISHIKNPQLKIFVAHEFMHLITFNQKDRMQNVQEDVWLNEGRADYVSTLLGYNDVFDGSNLQRRVRDFLSNPQDPLLEWQDSKYDYAAVSMLLHYLVDHYGKQILVDSLKSRKVGIASINEALSKNGITKDFAQIFTDWTVAMTVNSCTDGSVYCYTNKNLSTLKINPTLIFLPLTGNTSLSSTNATKNWSGNWQKIIGGSGDLKLEFTGTPGFNFQIPYVIYDKNNTYSVKLLKLNTSSKGEISIKNFGTQYNALVIIPSLQSKTTDFNGLEFTHPYTFKVSITGATFEEDPLLIEKLLAQIDSLKQQIAVLQGQNPTQGQVGCTALTNNLYQGLSGNQVRCLQQFLVSQGITIYPEALVTGNFGNLTRQAVIRFQATNDIFQTGYVGVLTRAKINSMLK